MYDNMNKEISKWLPFFIFNEGRKFRKASLSRYAKIIYEETKQNFPEIVKKIGPPFSKSWATSFINKMKFKILDKDERELPLEFSVNGKVYSHNKPYLNPTNFKCYGQLFEKF